MLTERNKAYKQLISNKKREDALTIPIQIVFLSKIALGWYKKVHML